MFLVLLKHGGGFFSATLELQAGDQGEFGIGLLSFWTVGEELVITSAGSDGKSFLWDVSGVLRGATGK